MCPPRLWKWLLKKNFLKKSKDKNDVWKRSKLCSNLFTTENVLIKKIIKIFFENVFLKSVIARKVISIQPKFRNWLRVMYENIITQGREEVLFHLKKKSNNFLLLTFCYDNI